MKIKILSIVFALAMIKVSAQSGRPDSGAANVGFGARTATTTGAWALWGNPAGVAFIDQATVSTGLAQHRSIPIATESILIAIPTAIGSIVSGMSRFGDDLYSDQMLSLCFANKIDITALGIRADVLQLKTSGYPTHRTVGITIGGIISAGKYIRIGASARNVNLPKWTRDEKLPVVLNCGILFQPTDEFSTMIEVEKNTDLRPTFKAGFEYSFKNKFHARTGVNLFPNAAFCGFGLSAWRVSFDYAMRYGIMPGYYHQLSASVSFKKKSTDS